MNTEGGPASASGPIGDFVHTITFDKWKGVTRASGHRLCATNLATPNKLRFYSNSALSISPLAETLLGMRHVKAVSYT